MPTCTVCPHPDREAIDEALVLGTSMTQLATTYELSKDAVRRHRTAHLSPALRKVVEARQSGGSVKAIDRLEELYTRASALLDRAEEKGSTRDGVAAIGQLRGIVETLAKLTGELDERPQIAVINVATSAEWLATRSALFDALRPYPDAAQAVASRLKELEP